MNGHQSQDVSSAPPLAARTQEQQHDLPYDSPVKTDGALAGEGKAIIDEAESEAETLITSPVKKREAANQHASNKEEPILETADVGDAQDDADAPGSPVDLDEIPVAKSTSRRGANGRKNSSDELSDVDDEQHSRSPSSSRASSQSREDLDQRNASLHSLNPRKRKHRASSVSLPNKRQSVESGRRRLRDLAQDEIETGDIDRSDSPRSRTHQRAASTQSFLDSNDNNGSRKRRAMPHTSSREAKQARWEESSVSSEATSHGQSDQKRPQRGVGRSTTGVGRPVGREHKRHVNKYGFTRLAEACESGDVELAREWREKDPEQLELAEFAGNKPLQIAALNGNAEVVEYLISEGCQVDCANVDKDTPLIDAAENGHIDVVRILLKAGVDPLRQNVKGQQALDVVQDDTDNATEIRAALRNAIEAWNSVDAQQKREEEEEQRYRAGPAKELHFMARTYENLLRLVQINDRNGVREFLDARVPVDNAIIAAAAKTGDLYLMNMLLAEMTDKKRSQKAEKPMLSVIGTSHLEMVKSLTELEQFNPLWTSRQGKKWSEIAEERAGPMWRQEVELLSRLEKEAEQKQADRRSSSPILRRSDGGSKHQRLGSKEEEDEEENSDEDMADDDTPRRKNGRRLLSRKDMRRKSRGDADDDSALDDDMEAKAASPPPKRGPGRPRAKSIIKQESKADDDTQRSLGSVKQSAEKVPRAATEVVHEKDKESSESALAAVQREAEDEARRQRDAEAIAARLRQEEEAQRQLVAEQEAAAAAAAAAEVQRQREAEAQAKQQAEKEAEHKRLLEVTAMDAARARSRQQVLDALPDSLSYLLDPVSDFSYDDRDAVDHVLAQCEPIQVVYASDLASNNSEALSTEPLVLNLAVAPLLGKSVGLQLLLPDDAIDPAMQETLLKQGILPGHKFADNERPFLETILHYGDLLKPSPSVDGLLLNGAGSSWGRELSRIAELHALYNESKRQLGQAPLALRWLSLQQVLEGLDPALHDRDIAVRDEWRAVFRRGLHAPASEVTEDDRAEDFFSQVCQHWEAVGTPQSCRHAHTVEKSATGPVRSRTSVHVTHEKR